MVKLRPEDSGEIIFDDGDSPIGLTQAFSSIDDEFDQFGYDSDAIEDPFAEDEQVSWDYNDKWAGFDWNAPIDDAFAEETAEELAIDADELEDEFEVDFEGEEPAEAALDEAESAAEELEEALEEEFEVEAEADSEIEPEADEAQAETEAEEPAEEDADAESDAEPEEEPVEESAEEIVEEFEEEVAEASADEGAGVDESVEDESIEEEPAEEPAAEKPAGEESTEEEPAGEEPAEEPAEEEPENIEQDVKPKAKHGRHAASSASAAVAAAKKAAHAAADEDSTVVPVGSKKPELTERQLKQRRTRRFLLGLLIVLALVIVGVGYYAYQLFAESALQAEQQTQEQASEAAAQTDIANATGNDAVQTASHTAEVPNLAQLIGKTQDEAVTLLEHGAMVSNTRTVDEKGSAIKSNVTVTLTSEPVDSRTGSPTVYLGVNKEGVIVQAGYSASASSLGFGTLSFRDAVNTEHVVEKTLQDAGISVPEGSVKVPDDSAAYSTYTNDGKTLVRERCSFEGETNVGDVLCTWSAVLSYDYTTMNLTGNMNDTVRVIYAYVTSPDAISDEDDEEDEDEEEKDK